MTNAAFPCWPSPNEQHAMQIEDRLRAAHEKMRAVGIDALRGTPDKDLGPLLGGGTDVPEYIRELRTSANLWRGIANDRAKQMYATRNEIKRGVIEELQAQLQNTLKGLE